MVTSKLVLHAVSEGKLTLDDNLADFFKKVPKDKEYITVRQLLTHTSGIVRVPIPDRIADCGKDVVAEYILDSKLAFEPGTDYEYSCNACILSGYILEKVYGMPLDEIYEKFIVKPLGLTRSRFNIKKDEENAVICCRWKYFGKSIADDINKFVKSTAVEPGCFERRQLVVCGTKGTVEINPLEWLDLECHSIIQALSTSVREAYDNDWNKMGEYHTTPVFGRYDAMFRAFADYINKEKENPYGYEYERKLHKLILKACGNKRKGD